MKTIEKLTNNDFDLIETAVNAYWNQIYKKLQSEDLGDLETKQLRNELNKSKEFITRVFD